ncbi:E3 ubiquitin-protein ligase TRIM39-like [Anomaloglossus baeobatrachus]|uniref:E3 ubiquitin-protein ligase TRIM39-like n=1 Tax=Anomaloglossus baeobatrachus TaxID=238106 RepID=UPI003F507DF2
MASADLRHELSCSICRNIYTDPVTLKCGQNFCWVCIDRLLDTEGGYGDYSCPECRATFRKWPPLQRNITLCNVVENFLSRQPHQEEITGICCTYCIHSPVPAVTSCLICEASLCDNHLKVHSKGPEHVLFDPSTSLENICSGHKKILEYYCTEDAACICVSCSLFGEHQGHKVEMLDEASLKKKKKLRDVLQKLITKRKKTEQRVQSLEERRRKAQEKASGEAERVTGLCIDIRRRLGYLEKKVLSEISRRKEQVSLSLSDVIHQLEIKKDKLSRKMRHIEDLCNMTDPLSVLQDPDTGDLCDLEEDKGDVDTARHDGVDQGVELISRISHTVSALINDVNVIFYVQDPADILLDVNTADNNLLISDDLKAATWTEITQNRPETVERFQDSQVMSRSGFTSGRHYWDVEISGSDLWIVGMCYPYIARGGRQSLIGNNNMSWGLYKGLVYNNQCSVRHDCKVIPLPQQISSDGVRICLDYEAGQLSFYELCDPIRLLHAITTTFTEPLHAVLYVYDGCIKIQGGINCVELSS